MLHKVIKKIQINKVPGNNLVLWKFNQPPISFSFNQQIPFDSPLPTWLSATHKLLLPKNTNTHIAKNYCPIACFDVTYKLHSSCINQCLMNNVYKNNIVTSEQAALKKRVRGNGEQLLINRTILKQVRSVQRNLVTVWLDYRKAFDSISHSCLLHALKLVKNFQIISHIS